MAESFFDKLKKTVIEGAATAASKAESATRLGKLHLDKMSEERRLHEKESLLGRFIYEIASTDGLDNLTENKDFLEKTGDIRLSHEAIMSIQTALETESKKAQEAHAEPSAHSDTAPPSSGSDAEADPARKVDSENKEN